MRASTLLFVVATGASLAATAAAQEASGVVEAVTGRTVTIRLDPGPEPGPGDEVKLSDEVAEVGRVFLKGAWTVKEVASGRAKADPVGQGCGDPQVGLKASIRIAAPEPKREPSGKPDPKPQPKRGVRDDEPAKGRASKGEATPSPRAGWATRRPSWGGFSLQVPPGYSPLGGLHESIVLFYQVIGTEKSPARLVKVLAFAIDPSHTAATLRDFRIDELSKHFQKLQVPFRGDGAISGRPTVWFRYTYDWEAVRWQAIEHVILKDGVAYEITLASPADKFDSLKPEFIAILESFRFDAAAEKK